MTTKIENKLQLMYSESKMDIYCDNRSYFTKSINKALLNPNVQIKICEKGHYWTSPITKFKYNLVIRINGKGQMWYKKDFSPESICNCFAIVTKMPHVKEYIHIHQDAYECSKCSGKGIIPHFMHVSQGVCFDCLGIGYKFHSGNW